MEGERVARTRATARRAKVGVEMHRFAVGCLEVEHAARHQDRCDSARDEWVQPGSGLGDDTHGSVKVVITLLTWPVFLAILNHVSVRKVL